MSSLMSYEQTHPKANNSATSVRLLPCSSGSGPTVHNFAPGMSGGGVYSTPPTFTPHPSTYRVQTTDSSSTSSIASSRTRLQCSSDDSGHSTDSQLIGMNPPFCSNGYANDGQYGTTADEDFEPQPRDRCNTWPMRRPNLEPQSATSPLMHERIPEEGSVYGSDENLNDMAVGQPPPLLAALQPTSDQMTPLAETPSPGQYGNDLSPGDLGEFGGSDSPLSSKKSTTRRNAWGNMSYADLITQAILSAPEKRLTLAQVYEWMTSNVPYFRDKGDSNSSSGWKNSIRHNLSLHSRFMRVQNEGAGKSSWWVINPDAKPGRNPRRRAATMDQSTKAAIEKKRRGARKRLEVRGSMQGLAESVGGSQLSMVSHDFDLNDDNSLGPNFEKFRARTQSNVSNLGGPPSPQTFYDDDLPPWANTNSAPSGPVQPPSSTNPNGASNVSEILDRTDQMRLDSEMDYRSAGSIKEPLQPQQHRGSPQMPMHSIKTEEPESMPMPPPYQEMNLMQSPGQMRPNLIHPQMPPLHMQQQPQQPKMMAAPVNNGVTPSQYFQQQANVYNMQPPMISQQQAPPSSSSIGGHWSMSQPQIMQQSPHQMQYHHQTSQPVPQMMNNGGMNGGMIMTSSSQQSLHMRPALQQMAVPPASMPLPPLHSQHHDLPMDLESLDTLDSQMTLTCDVQAVIEMEMRAQRNNAQLQFDI